MKGNKPRNVVLDTTIKTDTTKSIFYHFEFEIKKNQL